VSEPESPEEPQRATVRRAPKFGVFILVGAVLGAFVTLIFTSLYPADPNIGFGATYAYFLVYGIPFGVLVGALVALAFDRRSRRRARTIDVEHERVS
jgi:hypothetical protein